MKIAVLFGGTTAEREVSLASGLAVVKALRSRGHEVAAVDTARGFVPLDEEDTLLPGGVHSAPPDHFSGALPPGEIPLIPEVRNAEVAFLALHGGTGEDGRLQALLELHGVPYTGSGPLGSGIAMDKDISKRLLRDAGVPTLPWWLAQAPGFEYNPVVVREEVTFPCIVKPSRQGSSVGMHVVNSIEELDVALADAAKYDSEVLIERMARGSELTIAVVGGQPLAPIEIRPRSGLYDYASKYTAGMTEYLCPAPISAALTTRAQELSLRAFHALKLEGYARIDFILAGDELFCLEANTLPGMTATSLLPKAAAESGLSFPDLCERIVTLGLKTHRS
ncbi:MAG: D-alanine--D-alanine ligase [Gemmatimonadota bacterium]|jgi:D-alanine-D-alanine ligase|nr:D-alanine--D-alanine ligase [Gemmatimonadota bacterium]